jgi:phytoene desaturase
MFSSISSQIRKNFTHPYLRNILEFPVLFLGAKPQNTPALYSLMNYADLSLGTWYPMGGMHEIVKAMVQICEEQGVVFKTNNPVDKIEDISNGIKIKHGSGEDVFDYCVASADYHHVETQLLDAQTRNYNPEYWDKKTFAPSSLLYYIGVDKKIPKIKHHNLFFDKDFDRHADEIYTTQSWPDDPLFYACCPSKTDLHMAPSGKENLFILIPIATGMDNNRVEKDRLYANVIDRLGKVAGINIRDSIVYKKEYSVENFIEDYNSYKGNAYGLANTLLQTAFLKPKIKNKNLDRLYYTGQLTTPGPGVPPSLISGQVVAAEIIKQP